MISQQLAQSNDSLKEHLTSQQLLKEHVAEGKVSHKDPIWSTHAAVIIKYVGAAKRFTQGSCDGSTVCCTDELFTQGPHDGSKEGAYDGSTVGTVKDFIRIT